MPTARELLEQADALMRRNRASIAPGDDIPELTEEVAVAPEDEAVAAHAANDAAAAVPGADDVPELTDAVAYVDAVSIEAVPEDAAEVTRWLESELGAESIIGAGPDSIALVPPAPLRAIAPTHDERGFSDEADLPAPFDVPPAPAVEAVPPSPASAAATLAAFSGAIRATTPREPVADYAFEAIERAPAAPAEAPSVEASFELELEALSAAGGEGVAEPIDERATPGAEPAATPPDDPARWAALAEEIRMQVLQRIDIFTDTGLQQQLTTRLQPIVDRASADLVATINQHVGTLLRAYVAEAIEREIEKWKQGEQ